MDKKLELRIIESGYDHAKAKEVSLHNARQIIRDEVYSSTRDKPAGRILFDGMTQVIVRTGLGHSIMKKPYLAIDAGDGNGGLFIHSLQDTAENQRSSVFVERAEGYHVVVPKESYESKDSLQLLIKTENDQRASAKVELSKSGKTKVLYLPPTNIVESDKLFWHYVANQFGLKLTKIEPQYTCKEPLTPWYTSTDKRTKTNLTLGTRFRVYAVNAQFPTEMAAANLRKIVKGLDVNPQTVNGAWNPEFSSAGKSCETHILRGRGDQVVAYLERLLRSAA